MRRAFMDTLKFIRVRMKQLYEIINMDIARSFKMTNGNGKKPSSWAVIAVLGVLVTLFINLTGFGDRIFKRGGVSAVMAQNVKHNGETSLANVTAISTLKDTVNKQNTEIEVVKVQVVNLANKVEEQTTATNKNNDLLIEVLKRLPR